MTTTKRVQRHRQSEAARRRVTTRGKRVQRPRQPSRRAPRRRAKYQTAGMLGGFSSMCTALFVATGSVLWVVGSVATAAGGVASAYLEYRRDLLVVKRTGRPVGAPDPATAARRTDDLEPIQEPEPVDLDAPRGPLESQGQAQQRSTSSRAKPKQQHGPPGHEAKCKAKTKEACPYWRKANPGRAGKTARRKSS